MIHLVYPHRNKIAAPDVIGWQLSSHLARFDEVKCYNWDELFRIRPGNNDILIGHPHPFKHSVFRRSLKDPNWRRKILLCPFNHDPRQVGFIDSFIDECDLFLAICGEHWFRDLSNSVAARWEPKMRQIDLAISREMFPRIKFGFSAVNRRKFLYIGNDHPAKNLQYLSAIACRLSDYEFHWIGKGKSQPGLIRHGFLDFSLPSNLEFLKQFDFLITVGSSDANPTTILEAIAWGLIPVCTPTSGYDNTPGVINIPLDALEEACLGLVNLQLAHEEELLELQGIAEARLNAHYSWQRFGEDVARAICSDETPILKDRDELQVTKHIHSTSVMALKLIIRNFQYILRLR